MTQTQTPTMHIARLCFQIESGTNGNSRYFLPADAIGVEPGSKIARKLGLSKYRGKAYGCGFVFQSYNLNGDLENLVGAVKEEFSKGASKAERMPRPLNVWASMEWVEAAMMARMFRRLAPDFIEQVGDDYFIKIPVFLTPENRANLLALIFMHPPLKKAVLDARPDMPNDLRRGLDIRICTFEENRAEPDEAIPNVRDYELIDALLCTPMQAACQ
jgi:hypothetical protein